eukprot:Skav226604  [mRNA]  locus=scaffold848:86947:87141:+ [translate_table: standard]
MIATSAPNLASAPKTGRRREYEELQGLLVDLPKKVQHPIMVPFGPLASFPGHLVHTNEAGLPKQ